MKDYTIPGDAPNQTSRLKAMTRKAGYNIIIDEAVIDKVQDKLLKLVNYQKELLILISIID
jgi:class 3 adenylate cyclase